MDGEVGDHTRPPSPARVSGYGSSLLNHATRTCFERSASSLCKAATRTFAFVSEPSSEEARHKLRGSSARP
jgi:hypothetical protein